MRTLLSPILVLSLTSAAAASTWVVDPFGGGDFTTIQAAINASAPGDVLIVKEGSYAAFTLDRDLSILGQPGVMPRVSGLSHLLGDEMAVAGLEFAQLEVLDASGFVLLDGIEVTSSLPLGFGCEGMRIDGCAQVHIARSVIRGKDGDESCESRGLQINDSIVTITGSTLIGGTGWGDDFTGYDGMEGLDIRGESDVLLSQTSVYGGTGGSPEILFGGTGGNGSEAILMNWGEPAAPATCTVRGSSSVILQGGLEGQGIGALPAFAPVSGWGRLTLSGVSYSPQNFGTVLNVVMPSPAQPLLNLVGHDGPSAFKRLNLYGPAGQPLLVFASLSAAQLSAPGPVDGTLWLDPGLPVLILPEVLEGQEVAVNFTFTMPAVLTGLEGITVTFQGFAAGMGATGNYLATNPVHLLVR